MARQTDTPVQIHNVRIEDLSPLNADVVTARALAALEKLLDLTAAHFSPNGVGLFLKGKNVKDELTAIQKTWHISYSKVVSQSDADGVVLMVSEVYRVDGDDG